MVTKPAKMYRNFERSYTRREYMGGVPGSHIVSFDMGNLTEDFPVSISLLAKEQCQIRHNALEAARITANRYLLKHVGRTNFHLKLRVHPHQVLRENKMATGAGADRVSSGMRHAFGKLVGTAARVHTGQRVFTVSAHPPQFQHIKEAMRRIGYKLPTPVKIVVDRGQELVQ